MKCLKLIPFILIAALLQSCKTSRISNSSIDSNILFDSEKKITTYNRYCIIYYSATDTNKYAEKAVKKIDSIEVIKKEFQNLLGELRLEKIDLEIDTISKYKLRFISEIYKNEQVQGIGTQNNVLKKCDQKVELKYFIKSPRLVRSYSKKYLVVYSIPIVDYGNTYVRTSDSQYYFEKVISNE